MTEQPANSERKPKRHHWWPQMQAGYWTSDDGCVFVTRKDGSTFKTSIGNVGLEGHLYTRMTHEGRQDRSIEEWLSNEIESPFASVMRRICDTDQIERRIAGPRGPAKQARELKELGFRILPYDEVVPISSAERAALVNYVAATIVRNPRYLAKIREFHKSNLDLADARMSDVSILKTVALDNMLSVFGIYAAAIKDAALVLAVVDGSKEFLFSDAGVSVKEPWSASPTPFDAFVPLTPTMGLNILPIPGAPTDVLMVSRISGSAVRRYNRSALSNAEQFVFTRTRPPIDFIRKFFGRPAPAPFGFRWIDGRLETSYERARDYQ